MIAETTRRNDVKTRNALAVEHQGLVFLVAKHLDGRGMEIDDMAGEGQFGLLRACETYTRDLGKASTYLGPAIYRAMRDAMRAPRWRSTVQEDERSTIPLVPDHREPGLDAVNEHDALRTTVARLLACLTERERRIVVAYYGLDGAPERTQDAIAADLGLTKQRVHQLRVRALGRMREEGEK